MNWKQYHDDMWGDLVAYVNEALEAYKPNLSQATGNLSETRYPTPTGNAPGGYTPAPHTHPWPDITSTPTTLAGYGITDAQPLDSDLTAIAALATVGFGRGLLELSNGAAVRAYIGAGTGSGTVTSVALSLPAEFSVSGSPVSGSGTLAATWANESANRVFAGPTSGGAATPAFRALVAADIPDLSATYQPLDADLTAIAALSGTGLAARTAANTWAQRTITGTSNRISVTDGDGVAGNPTVDIAATYVGQASITTLGTIGTGVWQGTKVAEAYGGTNQSSYTRGDLLYASAANTLSKLAVGAAARYLRSDGTDPSWHTLDAADLAYSGLTTGQVLRATSASAAAFGALDLANSNAVTGILPAANGGTGVNNGSNTLTVPATGTAALLATANVFTAAQTVTVTDSGTTNATTTFTVGHNSSGTPAANFGVTTFYNSKSATVNDRELLQLGAVWATATDASRKARALYYIYDTSPREVIRMEASGSAAMIGFLGTAAVARQNITGVRTGTLAQLQTVVANLLTGIANLGLITDSTT